MKRINAILASLLVVLAVGCGGSSKTSTGGTTPGQPLDPQGNWLFTFTGDGQTAPDLQFAGQLFELQSPVVTSNEMGSAPFGFTCGGLTANGQASSVNVINLTATAVDQISNPATFALTGTIADDQAHMSGTWTTTNTGGGCVSDGKLSGTWTAQLLVAVTNNWTGTGSGSTTLTADLTENTDQTTINMGQVSGTFATSDTCFAGQLNVTGLHLGESLTLNATDSNGTTFTLTGTVDPTGSTITGTYAVTGGPCDGQNDTFTLSH